MDIPDFSSLEPEANSEFFFGHNMFLCTIGLSASHAYLLLEGVMGTAKGMAPTTKKLSSIRHLDGGVESCK